MAASIEYLSLLSSTGVFFITYRPSSDSYIRNGHFPTKCRRWITPTEITEAMQLIGQLNWLATQTRPDLSFDVSALKQENMECIRQINRTIKKAKKEKSQIHIPNLGNPKLLQIIAYSDASFANLTDGVSQGGYIIFLVGNNNQ